MSTHVAICLTSRGNYARTGTLLHALDNDPDTELDIIVAGASMIRKYGTLSELLREDGLEIERELHNVLEGGTPVASAKTTGLGMIEFTSVLDELDPDGVITIADRYETMSVTLAASYLNIPVIHTQGGEITGSIDEKVRHATTKMADYHFVSTKKSVDVVEGLGEEDNRVFLTGCPSIDLVEDINQSGDDQYDPQEDYAGVGAQIDINEDYLVVQYHPVATEYMSEYDRTWELINAVDNLDVQSFWFWPNMDAGTNQVSKAIREYRDQRSPDDVRFYINMHPDDYLTLVSNSACMVGNSSVGIRECSYLGKPTVNIGNRQQMRERGPNVLDVKCETEDIKYGIEQQLSVDHYEQYTLYGSGDAGEKMKEIIRQTDLTMKQPMKPEQLDL